MNGQPSGKGAIILVFNALFWAAAIIAGAYFFKGAGWDKDTTIWLIGGFVLVNGLLAARFSTRSRDCD